MHRLCGKAASISPWNKGAGAHFSVLFPEGRLRQVKKWVCGHLREVLSSTQGPDAGWRLKVPVDSPQLSTRAENLWLALFPP